MNDEIIQKVLDDKDHRDGMVTVLTHILKRDKAKLAYLKCDMCVLEDRIAEDEAFLSEMLENYNSLDNNL